MTALHVPGAEWLSGTSQQVRLEVIEQGPKGTSAVVELDRLRAQTQAMLRGRLAGFRIERVGGGVVLSGTARSFYAKQLALHAVMTGTCLPVVRNEIRVV